MKTLSPVGESHVFTSQRNLLNSQVQTAEDNAEDYPNDATVGYETVCRIQDEYGAFDIIELFFLYTILIQENHALINIHC